MAASALNGLGSSTPLHDVGEEQRSNDVTSLIQYFDALLSDASEKDSQSIRDLTKEVSGLKLQLHDVTQERDGFMKERNALLEAARMNKMISEQKMRDYEKIISEKNSQIVSLKLELKQKESALDESRKLEIRRIRKKIDPLAKQILRLKLEKVMGVYSERLNEELVKAVYARSTVGREGDSSSQGLWAFVAKKVISTWIHYAITNQVIRELNESIHSVTTQDSLNELIKKMNSKVQELADGIIVQIEINLDDL